MKPRILLVDDVAAIRFAVADYFSIDYEVDGAADPDSAERLLERNAYDLVIVDLSLSGRRSVDGLDLIRHVRATQDSTPVLLLTGSSAPDVAEAALRAGAAAALFKSMGLPAISRVVASLLRQRQRATNTMHRSDGNPQVGSAS